MCQKIRTRIAGIEMEGYPGILNILTSKNVRVSGPGTINGQGSPWYEKYWGKDGKGGMRKVYEEKGLRWAWQKLWQINGRERGDLP